MPLGSKMDTASHPPSRGTRPPWTGAWTGRRGIPRTAGAACAIGGGVSAAQAPVGPDRTYGKEKVCGSIRNGALVKRVIRAPRTSLGAIPGIQLVAPAIKSTCCGLHLALGEHEQRGAHHVGPWSCERLSQRLSPARWQPAGTRRGRLGRRTADPDRSRGTWQTAANRSSAVSSCRLFMICGSNLTAARVG